MYYPTRFGRNFAGSESRHLMDHIRVCNLRCLADSGAIEIKPITLLVGANSSGKSTFLRVFPLLKQSHEMRTLGGLVLNEGDVDFGFFDEAIHRNAQPAELKLEIGLTLQRGYYQGGAWNNFLIEPVDLTCTISYVQRAHDSRYPRLRAVELELVTGTSRDKILVRAQDDGTVSDFQVNDFVASSEEKKSLNLRITRGVVPQLIQAMSKQSKFDESFDVSERIISPFDKRLIADTAVFFHGRTAEETRLATFRSIPIGSPEKMLGFMRSGGLESWVQRVRGLTPESSAFRNVRNLLFAKRVNDILESVNIYVSQLAKSVHYFQPVRASVQRYYLSRDVSIESVNSTGLNVAMVLGSLSSRDQLRFREWMRKYFGFEVFPESVGDGARISLRMKDESSGAEFNLADTGFGFSQMLPFLVQVWSLIEGQSGQLRRPRPSYFRFQNTAFPMSFIVAIEQPELHLHPALQARLADLIVAMANLSREKQVPIRFVLETHSQTIIERIGQSVECKLLEPQDVQIVLFELDWTNPRSNTSSVRTTSFDDLGVLVNWPFGFLSAPLSLPTSTTSERANAVPN